MAQDTKRSVTIWINGKEVENSYKSIQKEQRMINAELNKMIIGSDEYNKTAAELKKVNAVLASHRQSLRETAKEVDGVSGSFSKLGGLGGIADFAAGGLLSGGITAVAEGVIAFGASSKQAFEEAELAAIKLEQAYKSTGGTVGLSLKEIQDSITELETKTGIDGDEIADKVTAPLLTFKSVQGEVFKAAQASILDLSTFMKTDLQSASIKLGKALEDPVKGISALRKSGVSFTEGQQKVIKALVDTGDKAKAQAIILKEVNTQVGGQAEAQAKPLQKLATMFGNFQEKVGKVIVETMELLAPVAVFFVDVLGKAFDYLADAVKPVIDAFKRAFDGVSDLSGVSEYFNKVLDATAGVYKSLGIVIGWAIDLFANYYKWIFKSADGTGFFSKALGAAKDLLYGFLDFLADLPSYLEGFAAGAKQLWTNITTLDFSKSIVDASKKAMKGNKDLIDSQEKLAQETARQRAAEKVAGEKSEKDKEAAAERNKKNAEKRQKANDEAKKKAAAKLKKDQEDAEKALQDHLNRSQKLLDDAATKERQNGQSDLAKKIDDTNAKYAEELATALKYSESKDKEVAAKAVERGIALQKAMNNEILVLQSEALDKQLEMVDKSYDQAELSVLSANEKEIQSIRDKYAEKISVAVQLEEDLAGATQDIRDKAHAQTLQLQENQTKEINAATEKQNKEHLDNIKKAQEDYNKDLQALSDIKLSVGDDLYTTVDAQYNKLLGLAQQNGLDTFNLLVEYEKKKAELEKQSNEARLLATGEALGQLGTALTSFTDDQAKQGVAWVVLQRGLALAQIAIDTSRAISALVAASSSNPTNAVTFGAAGAAQFIAGLAQILTNVASAKKLLSTPIPQAFDGGYKDVTGAQDGKRYSARYLGNRRTGMLPSTPSLVLASEKGPEYYVSNKSLRNPAVANLVQMIENLERRRVPQRVDGGVYPDGASIGGGGSASGIPIVALIAVISQLNNTLNGGIYAKLTDQALIDGNGRLNDLNTSSNGRILQTA